MWFAVLVVSFSCATVITALDRSFTIDYGRNCFMKDNKPFRYISGEIHYFRIPSFYWRDRLLKAKALGVNTIQTYIPWNFHEVQPSRYDFSGEKDVLKFIDLANELGLLVILRPGPYICAEWDFGGFPWWLAKNESMQFRTSKDVVFIQYVETWFGKLLPMLTSKLYKNGGPVIAFQVENEYGTYLTCDKGYLQFLKSLFEAQYGNDVVLFTVDNYSDDTLRCGTIPELFTTVDFGIDVDPNEAFKQLRKYQKTGPIVNTEFYTGWLDVWGEPHQRRDASAVADHLDKILALNASVNMYMLHGGTNFGFMNGAYGLPDPMINPTSYDYDAPISEAGDVTEKYFKIRDVLKKYVDVPTDPVPENTTKAAYGTFPSTAVYNFSQYIDLIYDSRKPVKSATPLTMEEMDLGYGFANYRTEIPEKYQNITTKLTIDYVSDRTLILMDGDLVLIFEKTGFIEVNLLFGKRLDILIENQGRVNYAKKGIHYLPLQKGIVGSVYITDELVPLFNWSNYALNDSQYHTVFENHARKTMESAEEFRRSVESPHASSNDDYMFVIYGWINLDLLHDTYGDTFLYLHGFKKGQVYVNGINIGRFWQNKGPQLTLFVPKVYLIPGINAIQVFSLDKIDAVFTHMEFVKEPILG